MAIAVRRTYACPVCGESFTKWGLCQGHVRSSAPCKEALEAELKDPDHLQERCREAAAAAADALAAPTAAPSTGEDPSEALASLDAAVPDAAAVPVSAAATAEAAPAAAAVGIPSAPFMPTPTSSAPLPPGLSSAPSAPFSEQQIGGLAERAVSRLERALRSGHLQEVERADLFPQLEVLASHPAVVQEAAVKKFLAPAFDDLRHIVDKRRWLERCLQFCARTTCAAASSSSSSPSEQLLAALGSHALLPDALTKDSWDRFAALHAELQLRAIAAVRGSLLANVRGSVSDHFDNLVENEKAIWDLELAGFPKMDRWPAQRAWDSIEGTSYHRLLQQIQCSSQQHSEERVLAELTQFSSGAAVQELGALLFFHTSTAEARQRATAAALSALHAASAYGLSSICARLIAEGLDVNERAGQEETTPLHLASAHGHTATVRLLLKQRARPDTRDGHNHTPLFHAVRAAAKEGRSGRRLFGACDALLCAGADSGATEPRDRWRPGGPVELEGKGGEETPQQLAECHDLAELRNLMRLHERLARLRQRFDLGDATVAELRTLQFETAMFLLLVFERHAGFSPEAAQLELRALISSEFVQARDQVQRYGNMLALRLGLSKKAVDALAELPPEAGMNALKTFQVQEVAAHVYQVPAHLNSSTSPKDSASAPQKQEVVDWGCEPSSKEEEEAPVPSAPEAEAPPRFRGRVRKWDSERGFGFIVQDSPLPGEEEGGRSDGSNVFVHRKNVVGSSATNHIDLPEGSRIMYRLGAQPDGRPHALEATLIDSEGNVLPVHQTGIVESVVERSIKLGILEDPSLAEDSDTAEIGGRDPVDISRRFLKHLRRPEIQELAKERRGKVEAWLRCVGWRRHNSGRRDDAMWKREIEKRLDLFLENSRTPLQKRDFDFRVRRSLLEFSVHSSVPRVSEALAMVELSTQGKGRDDVRSWPAYVATLLRNFDPKLHEVMVERDKRSRIERPDRGPNGVGVNGANGAAAEAVRRGMSLGDEEFHSQEEEYEDDGVGSLRSSECAEEELAEEGDDGGASAGGSAVGIGEGVAASVPAPSRLVFQ